ncbi:MAG: branched-chain amino acid ABC transporter permease [Planctomycetota bacterium]
MATRASLPTGSLPSRWTLLPRNGLPAAVGIALALGLHFWLQPAMSPFHTKVMLDSGINIILAVSLTLVNGFTGQFSIGHAGFMALGGYASAAIMYYGSYRLWGGPAFAGGVLSWTTSQGAFDGPWLAGGDALFVVACLGGGLVAAVAGYLVGLPSLRLRGDYLAIVTLGFGEIVRVVLQSSRYQLFDAGEIARASPLHLATTLGGSLGFISLPFYTTLFWVYLFVGVTLLVTYRIKYSSYGRAFLAIREDEVAAEAMGIHTTRYKVRAFVLSAFFAGIAGALYAHSIGSINATELGFQKSFDLIIMVVLGGMGSISGSALAAVLLTMLPEVLRKVTEHINQVLPAAYALPDLRMIIYSLALILMMILRPQGLFGLHEIWDWRPWRRPRPSSKEGPPRP